jgi:hypothetical protein
MAEGMRWLPEEHTEWELLRLPRTLCEEALPGFSHNLYHRVEAIRITIISALASIILSR